MKNYLNLKKLRIEKGLSQKELAEKMGVSDNVITNYETKKKTPNLKRIVQMADILDCSLDQLIDLDSAIEEYHEELYNLSKNKQ